MPLGLMYWRWTVPPDPKEGGFDSPGGGHRPTGFTAAGEFVLMDARPSAWRLKPQLAEGSERLKHELKRVFGVE